MTVWIRTGSRLHFGFLNLALSHTRLYGSIGVAIETPEMVVRADQSDTIDCPDDLSRSYLERVVSLLDVPGARIRVEQPLPRHVGLGSGTQLALSIYSAVAHMYDHPLDVRGIAPALDRGYRSGISVAAFEAGRFVVDAGQPADTVETGVRADGSWTVPSVAVRHPVPDDWRFVLVLPDIERGKSGDHEDVSMHRTVERANPEITAVISRLVTRQLLPALAVQDHEVFGETLTEIGRLNGIWYSVEQGGVYRPPLGSIVEELSSSHAITGTGQSSWGPTVYGVTCTDHAGAARQAALDALSTVDVDGDVIITAARNVGASVKEA